MEYREKVCATGLQARCSHASHRQFFLPRDSGLQQVPKVQVQVLVLVPVQGAPVGSVKVIITSFVSRREGGKYDESTMASPSSRGIAAHLALVTN